MEITATNFNLWELVDQISKQRPLSRQSAEQIFHVNLTQSDSSNRYFTFWNGDGGILKDKTRVSRILLGLPNSENGSGATLTLKLADACHTLPEVRARYGDPALVGVPSGQSEDEETTYKVKLAWGSLTFGFSERRPTCVASVGIAINPASE